MQMIDPELIPDSILSLETFDFAKIYAQVILNQSDDLLEYYVHQEHIQQQKVKFRLYFQRAHLVLFEQEDIEKHYLLYLLSLKLIEQSQIAILMQIYQSMLSLEDQSYVLRDLFVFQEFLLEQQILEPKKLDVTSSEFIQKQFLDLFALEKGFFRVLSSIDLDLSEGIKVGLSPIRLLIQGIQKNYSKSKLYALQCHPNISVQKPPFSLWESDLYDAERQVLALANGGSVANILAQVQLEARFALALIYALILLKDLKVVDIKTYMPQATSFPAWQATPIPSQNSQVYLKNPSIFQPLFQPLLTPQPTSAEKIEQEKSSAELTTSAALKLSAELDAKTQKDIDNMKVIHQVTISENYFKLLNVPQNCTVELVQKHWSFLKQKLDQYQQIKQGDTFSKEEIKNLALIIDDAYRILSSDALKSQYIEALKNPPVVEMIKT